MAKTYRPYRPEQDLLPPSPRDWLPDDHLAYFVSELVRRTGSVGHDRAVEAKRALEARAREEAATAGSPPEAARPDEKAQYNFTDPESRMMKGPDGFVQAYNAQVAVEGTLQLIVGQAVTQETNDKRQLQPMVQTIVQQADQTPVQLLADRGYCSDENLGALGDTPIDLYIATQKQKHGERPTSCPRGPVPQAATRTERMARKLLTKRGAAVYAARKANVEPRVRPDQTGARLSAILATRP